MNKQQMKAIKSLEKALDRCDKVGLKGGVFDSNFCVWSQKIDIDHDNYFFAKVDKYQV